MLQVWGNLSQSLDICQRLIQGFLANKCKNIMILKLKQKLYVPTNGNFVGGIVQSLQKFSIIADRGLDECISSNEIKREPCENTKPSFKSQKVRNIIAQLKVPHMKILSELKLSESCVNHL